MEFNSFQANIQFLYPMKTKIFWCFQGYRIGLLAWNKSMMATCLQVKTDNRLQKNPKAFISYPYYKPCQGDLYQRMSYVSLRTRIYTKKVRWPSQSVHQLTLSTLIYFVSYKTAFFHAGFVQRNTLILFIHYHVLSIWISTYFVFS